MTMTTNETTPKTRTFQYREDIRAGEEWGDIHTVTTEVLTELPDGRIHVSMRCVGMHEGTRINQRDEKTWPLGPTMESCARYRLTHGYTEVK
jgi:hypothetical protein